MSAPNRLWARIEAEGIEPEIGAPLPERVIAGRPITRSWTVEDTGDGLYAGIWEADEGEWRVEYEEWEFFHVLEGVSVLTEEGGAAVTLSAGDGFVIRPGFKGTWRVVKPTRKQFVVRV
jgi:uncharacterized protein